MLITMYLTQNGINPTSFYQNIYCAYIFIALPYLRFLYVSKHKFLVILICYINQSLYMVNSV